jgi:ABC-type hemin transport system substrate-binding protein
MKKGYLEWLLLTAGGAIIGAIAVERYKKYRADKAAEALAAAKPKEIVIIEKL